MKKTKIKYIEQVKCSKLKPNPKNDEIYSKTDLTQLKTSLETNGQLEPIVVNKDYQIISGHRRFYAITQLKWDKCNVRVEEYENEIIALIEYNTQRQKTPQDIYNEFQILEQEYKKTLGGQGRRNDLKGDKRHNIYMEFVNKTGVGLSKLKQIKSIGNYEPTLLEKVSNNELSVPQAYKIVQEKYIHNRKRQSDDEKLKTKLKKFLKSNDVSNDILIDVLKNTHPYSQLEVVVKHNEEFENTREELIDHLDFLKSLDAQEIVIYQKLEEIQNKNYSKSKLKKVFNSIYQFKDIKNPLQTLNKLDELEPTLELVDKNNLEDWEIMRVLISNFNWFQNLGRSLKYFVKDRKSKKILGIINLGSDFTSLPPRDDYIKWNTENKFQQGKLNNILVAQTIVPTQPFGYNFLGGKLLSIMLADQRIQTDYKSKYGDELVGITTTSLFGSFSQYNNIPCWKKVGSSKGQILIKPNKSVMEYWNDWLKENHRQEFDEAQKKSSPLQKKLMLLYDKLSINKSKYKNEQSKGVYFMELYENTNKFLRNEISNGILTPNIKCDLDVLLKWWRNKAVKRYEKLQQDNKLQTDTLWYEELSSQNVKSWLKSRGK
jgi:hypothetical protein